jgi:hypothetical protein
MTCYLLKWEEERMDRFARRWDERCICLAPSEFIFLNTDYLIANKWLEHRMESRVETEGKRLGWMAQRV